MNARIDKIAKTLEAAKATYQQGLDSLKNNGRAVYAPDEEARRRQELQSTYQAAQRVAQDELQSAIAEAEQAIVDAGVADPLSRLASGDLEKASHLRGFVADDYQSLTAAVLVERAREALQGGDKATIAVHLRYGRQALETRFSNPGEGYELKQAVTELEEVFTDRAKRDAAQATLDAGQGLQVSMATANYLERTYGAQRPIRAA
jgi:hypothetical protein